MSNTITSSDLSFHTNFIHRLPRKSNLLIFSSCYPSMIKHPYHVLPNQESKSNPFNITYKFNGSKHKVTMAKGPSDDIQPESPVPAKPPPAAWKKWMVGIMLSIILPTYRHKGGPLLILKSRVDRAVETVESLTEIVEDVAEGVEKVADEIGDKLPEDTKLREAVDSIEKLAREAVKEADLAQDLINKVQDAEKVLEGALMEPKKDQAKNRSAQEQAPNA
ncbi:uncharacterized protein LOC132267160 [Cornus florida]|uniref:uncharacterized protein LOC132267160 n=1 Tax=Cornus florida TaxID=4283 RepID=UPI0028983D3E|nr:uncharacterized protein LOC132267160 [Cornus florida]